MNERKMERQVNEGDKVRHGEAKRRETTNKNNQHGAIKMRERVSEV